MTPKKHGKQEDQQLADQLLKAVEEHDVLVLEKLISDGVNFGHRFKYGLMENYTVLHIVVLYPWLTRNFTIHRWIRAIRVLLDSGADVNARDSNGNTPLITFAGTSDPELHDDLILVDELIKLLIHYGADINAKNDEGLTALHEATAGECYHITKTLLIYGADVNATDNRGYTPLHVAIEHFPSSYDQFGFRTSTTRQTELLITHGANVNARDSEGQTPLHKAAILVSKSGWDNRGLALITLIKAGADMSAKDTSGNTFIDLVNDEIKKHISDITL